MRYVWLVFAAWLAGLSATSAADLAEVLRQDLAPLTGQVAAVRENEILLNVDASHGVAIGDVFTVIRPGESIVDPGSGTLLGIEERVIATLRVTEILQGFSKAVPIGHAGSIRPQDEVRRFSRLQAQFWDYTEDGERVYTQVRDALPALRWVDYDVAQSWRPDTPSYAADGSNLYFLLEAHALEIRDGEGRLIRAYDVAAEGPGNAQFTTTVEPRAPAVAVASPPAAPSTLPAAPAPAPPPVVSGASPLPPGVLRSERVTELPAPVLMADFIQDRSLPLVAATDGSSIRVYALEDKAIERAAWTPSTRHRILALTWWRPAPAEPLFVAATTWDERNPRGVILRFEDDSLNEVDTLISSLVGTFDRDGDGDPETLLRQESDPDAFFGNRVTQGEWAENRLSFADWEEPLPRTFTVTGSEWADLTGDGQRELLVVYNNILFVYQGTEVIYKSPKIAGGSVSFLNYNATPGVQDFLLETARFEIRPVAYDVNGDGGAEVIMAASKGMSRFLPGIPTGVDESWLALVEHDQGRFTTRPLTETFENPIQGLGLTPNGLLFLVKDELPRIERAGTGAVYRFPLYRRQGP